MMHKESYSRRSLLAVIVLTGLLLIPSLAMAGPADPLDQAALSKMTAPQLQTEFDATIQMARDAQARYHQSRGRRTVTTLIPVVGLFGAGETASRANNLMAYKCKLQQLKRELKGRFPKEWEETKKKWSIDDAYLER